MYFLPLVEITTSNFYIFTLYLDYLYLDYYALAVPVIFTSEMFIHLTALSRRSSSFLAIFDIAFLTW